MIPDGVLSTIARFGPFIRPVRGPGEVLRDYELAGNNIQDGTRGMLVRTWTCYVRQSSQVWVSAPGVAPVMLFDRGVNIQEVALAFDNNMNPFVAFREGLFGTTGTSFIYWFDSLDSTQKFSAMPAGMTNLRACVDEHRPSETGVTDVVFSYIRSQNLYVRYQRERYQTEHLLKSGLGPNAELVSVSMNRVYRLMWRLRRTLPISGSFVVTRPYLGDIVMDLCVRSGIPRENVDVSELYNDSVAGLKVAVDDGLDKIVDGLRQMFFFDKSDYDRQLHFPKRGRNVVARIPYSDLLRGEPIALKQTRINETKLVREVTINHLDPDGGYAKNSQRAMRRSNMVNAEGKKKIDSTVVLTADQAATAAATILKTGWHEPITYELSTSIKWTELTNGDVIEVEDSTGIWHRVRIEDRNEDSGAIDWTVKQDGGYYTYSGLATGNVLRPPISTTPGIIGETRLEILNIPVMVDQNDELGLYIAASGDNSAWVGFQLLYSIDGGNTYTEAFTAQSPSTLGDTESDLREETSYEYQGDQTVDVIVNFSLTSINYEQLLGNQNRCVIGDEVLQFQTATLLGRDGSRYRYRLSGLLRGRYDTAPLHWPAGTRFVFIDTTVVFAQAQRAMLGSDIYYKPVSIGTTEDETTPTAYLFDEGVSQLEWRPSRVAAVRDGSNNVVVTWAGRMRLGRDTDPFHSKYFRGYRVKFSNGHIIDTMSETATYSSAPAGVTVQVCGLNEITGEGTLSATVPT